MLIAFIGPAQAGKTTAAAIMEEQGFTRLPFAAPLKNMLKELGLTHGQLHYASKDRPADVLLERTPRHAMQTLGTWGREQIHPDLWLESWKRSYRFLSSLNGDVVVDDARYLNELDTIRSMGGVIVRIMRDQAPIEGSSHSSEQEWKQMNPDYYVTNAGTRNDLSKALIDIFGDRRAFRHEDVGC